MPLGHTQITGSMTVREAFLNVLNEDIGELFSRVEALEQGGLSGVAIATEEEAIQGQNNIKMMTPLRVRQAISYNLPIATEQEAVQGQDNTKVMTPLRVRQAIVSNSEDYITTSMHTKSLHDSLHIDADTVDGKHASELQLASDDIVLQSGKIIDFADETGDKIRFYGSSYGVGVNSNELTLYAPSNAEVSVRSGAYNGTKLGDVIHTGNMSSKGVNMTLRMYQSTNGPSEIVRLCNISITIGTSYSSIGSLSIPWSGTTTYGFVIYNNSDYPNVDQVYIKLNSTEYGPYTVYGGATVECSLNYQTSSASNIDISVKKSGNGNSQCKHIVLKTGNADCMYKPTFNVPIVSASTVLL